MDPEQETGQERAETFKTQRKINSIKPLPQASGRGVICGKMLQKILMRPTENRPLGGGSKGEGRGSVTPSADPGTEVTPPSASRRRMHLRTPHGFSVFLHPSPLFHSPNYDHLETVVQSCVGSSTAPERKLHLRRKSKGKGWKPHHLTELTRRQDGPRSKCEPDAGAESMKRTACGEHRDLEACVVEEVACVPLKRKLGSAGGPRRAGPAPPQQTALAPPAPRSSPAGHSSLWATRARPLSRASLESWSGCHF